MKIFGIGTDLVEVERIRSAIERHGKAFINRIFTPQEQGYCESMKQPAIHYAARFAAKEAAAKALGTGIGRHAALLDLQVARSSDGAPILELRGAAAEFAQKNGISQILISLSHTENYATAQAIATCEENPA
ncbi:MAG: holo-ACP synthase [Luteolibacter sp.]